MKRKEIAHRLDGIKASIQPGTPVEIVQNKIDKLIDDILIDSDKQKAESPEINVTVNINNPENFNLNELSEKVKEMIMCEWGRL